MYQLTWQEVTNLKSQFVTSSSRSQFVTLKHGQNIKYLPSKPLKLPKVEEKIIKGFSKD